MPFPASGTRRLPVSAPSWSGEGRSHLPFAAAAHYCFAGDHSFGGASMIPVTIFKDRTLAVFGLGGSGLATAQALITGGAA